MQYTQAINIINTICAKLGVPAKMIWAAALKQVNVDVHWCIMFIITLFILDLFAVAWAILDDDLRFIPCVFIIISLVFLGIATYSLMSDLGSPAYAAMQNIMALVPQPQNI